MYQIILKNKFGASYFENNIDLYEYIRKMEPQKHWDYIDDCKQRKRWSGNVTYNEAMQNLLYGNKDTTPKFIEGLKVLGYDTESNTGIFMNTEGFAYDMGAVVSGTPECCVDMKAPELKKTIRIVLDYTAPANTDEESIANRGIAILNLLYTLMSQGYIIQFELCRVSKLHFWGQTNGQEVDNHYISVKVPTETLTIGTLAFYSSLEFFRVIMILAESMMLDSPMQAGNLSGTRDIEDYNLKKDVFFIPSFYMDENAGRKCRTIDGATDYINNLYNKYCETHNLTE